MVLPDGLLKKYLSCFDELINEGERLYELIKDLDEPVVVTTRTQIREPNCLEIQGLKDLKVWNVHYESLLDQVIPKGHIHRKLIEQEENFLTVKGKLEMRLARLKALKADFENGFLGDLRLQIEAEISADYMGQAEQLLAEGQTGKYDHVPAAVLSGAVLEKALRALCAKQVPPISTVKANGTPLTLNPLIEELKKVGLFNELKAKQLRAWADIRNSAAHGKFDEFNRVDVEGMIKGIDDFLATYML